MALALSKLLCASFSARVCSLTTLRPPYRQAPVPGHHTPSRMSTERSPRSQPHHIFWVQRTFCLSIREPGVDRLEWSLLLSRFFYQCLRADRSSMVPVDLMAAHHGRHPSHNQSRTQINCPSLHVTNGAFTSSFNTCLVPTNRYQSSRSCESSYVSLFALRASMR